MTTEAELHTLLLKLRDVEKRAEMHRERAEALGPGVKGPGWPAVQNTWP